MVLISCQILFFFFLLRPFQNSFSKCEWKAMNLSFYINGMSQFSCSAFSSFFCRFSSLFYFFFFTFTHTYFLFFTRYLIYKWLIEKWNWISDRKPCTNRLLTTKWTTSQSEVKSYNWKCSCVADSQLYVCVWVFFSFVLLLFGQSFISIQQAIRDWVVWRSYF